MLKSNVEEITLLILSNLVPEPVVDEPATELIVHFFICSTIEMIF